MAGLREGWLTKEGGGFKSWKKRWFVLEGGALTYYAKKGGEKKGEIQLKTCGSTRAEDYKDKPHCFKIVTTSRTYHFCAPDGNSMKEWIEAITNARKQVLGDSGASTSLSRMRDKAERNGGSSANTQATVKVEDFETLKVSLQLPPFLHMFMF